MALRQVPPTAKPRSMPEREAEQPQEHALRPSHQKQLTELTLLARHHQALVEQLNAQIVALLDVGYGVDLAHERWNIDLDAGVVSRLPDPEPPRTPDAA